MKDIPVCLIWQAGGWNRHTYSMTLPLGTMATIRPHQEELWRMGYVNWPVPVKLAKAELMWYRKLDEWRLTHNKRAAEIAHRLEKWLVVNYRKLGFDL